MDPETLFIALRKNAVLVAMHVALGAVLGLVLGLLTPPVYTSTASANIGAEQPDSSQPDASVLNYMTNILPTLVEMGTSESALTQVADATGLSKDEVRRSVTVSAKTETIIMEISASHSDPELAQAIAEAEIAALDSSARDLSEKSQNSDLTLTVAVIDQPSLPSSPSSLSAGRTAIIGAVIGLAAGVGMALLLYVLHRKDPEGHAEAPLVVLGRRQQPSRGARAQPAPPAQPSQAGYPPQPSQADQPTSPAQPAPPTQPAPPAQPSQAGYPARSVPPRRPPQPGQPAQVPQAPQPEGLAQPGRPPQPVRRSTRTGQTVPPTQPGLPAQPTPPAAPFRPAGRP